VTNFHGLQVQISIKNMGEFLDKVAVCDKAAKALAAAVEDLNGLKLEIETGTIKSDPDQK
jgi:hypothetical protein